MTQLAIRRGCEQFPRRVQSLDELPAAVYAALQQLQASHDLTRMVVIPPQQQLIPRTVWRRVLPFAWEWTPHRTLVFDDQRVVIVEGTQANALNTIIVPAADMITLQIDIVLLYSYFALRWTENQQIAQCKIEFNAVELRLLEPGLQQLQHVNAQTNLARHHPAPPPVATRHFPLKFHNYGRISLLPGEEVRFARYQPMLRQPGKRFRPYVTPNRAILLTDQHLLVLEDELPHLRNKASNKYRINRVFYPRGKVLTARAERRANLDWLCITVGARGAQEEIRLALSEADIAAFLTEFKNWFLRQDTR